MIVLREIVMVCCIYSITQNVYNMCKLCHINGGLFYAFYILWKIFVTCIYSMYMFVSKTSQTNFYVFIINECEGVNDCDINSDCINTDGSYTCTCTCHPGYSAMEETAVSTLLI